MMKSKYAKQNEEIKNLREENENLKIEIRELKEQFAVMVANMIEEKTKALTEELNKSTLEIARLKAIINKDSSNSSKPPRTNGFKSIPNSREESKNKKGGQKGHSGKRLTLPENLDELEEQGFVERRVEDHTTKNEPYISRFTIDVETKVIIIEHRYAEGSKIPEGHYNEVSYGDNLKATSVLLLKEGIIGEKRLAKIIHELSHSVIDVSPATIESFCGQFAKKLIETGEIQAIEDDLLNGEVLNTDDTSTKSTERIVYPENEETGEDAVLERSKKTSLRVTLRTYSNRKSTLYTSNPKKDIKGIERDKILPRYKGILCHDHESKFYNYGGGKHGTCGEHLCRNLKGLYDLKNCTWANEMRQFMYEINRHKNEDQAIGLTECDPEILSDYQAKYDQLIEDGSVILSQMNKGDLGFSEFNAMLNRLKKHKENYLLFIEDYKVPFTNNLAERDLRQEKTKEKVSGTFRSWKGVVEHATIRSFVSTVKKRGLNLLASISNVIKGNPVLNEQ